MNKSRVQSTGLFLIAAWILFSLVSNFIKEKPEEISIPLEASEPAGSENPQDRAAYETMMLVDPKTGEIPHNIKFKEREFANRLNQANEPVPGIESDEANEETEVLNWRSIGPDNIGGRTRAIAIDVTDESVILAGAVSGGVWRSEDGGASWSKTTGALDLHSVTCIVQDTRPGKEHIWYYGTGELVGNSARGTGAPLRGEGIYKSEDGGRTWQVLPSTATNDPATFNFPFNYVWDIVLNPNSNDDEIIAAIFGGIVKSDDGGATWTTVLGNDLLAQGGFTDLNDQLGIFYTDVHVTSDGTFFATLSSITNDPNTLSGLAGIYRSTNGDNWQRVRSLTNTANRRTELGSSAGNPDLIYVVTDAQSGVQIGRFDNNLTRYTDLTANLPLLGGDFGDFNPQNSYNLMIAVHPENDQVVYLGGTNLYRSTDGFSSTNNTTWVGGYDVENDASSYPNHHPDQHDVIFYPSNANRMISVNDGGVFRTENNLANEIQYISLNNGYVTTQYYTAQISRFEDDNFVLGGTQDNGTLASSTVVNSTARVLGGDGAFVASTKFGIYYYISFQNARMFRVTLDDNRQLTSFARIDPIGAGQNTGQNFLFINPYVLDPNNQNRMYLAGGDFVWRNRNLSQIPSGSNEKTGFNWTRMDNTNIPSGSISALDISTEPANILYFGTTNGQLYKVTNANIDASEVQVLNQQSGVSFPGQSNISSISIDPTNADNVLVTFSNYGIPSIFFSQDGGTSFTDVSGNLEENLDGTGNGPSVRWAEIVPLNDDSYQYYVGTSTGLYSATTLNSTTTWTQEGAGTIGNVVTTMIDHRRSDGVIVAATHGNGLYQSEVTNVKPEPPSASVDEVTISNAFPNPFTESLTVQYALPESDFVVMRIYDMHGQLITIPFAGLSFQGENEFFWDGTNSSGARVAAGIYMIRLTYRDQNTVTRVIVNHQ